MKKSEKETLTEIQEFMADVFDLREKISYFMIDNKVDMDISIIAMNTLVKELIDSLNESEPDYNYKKYINKKSKFFHFMKSKYDEYHNENRDVH